MRKEHYENNKKQTNKKQKEYREMNNKKIGEVIRIEWNQETGSVRLIMEITDPIFKSRVLHSKDLQDIITISGKDVMVVASRRKDEE